MMLPRPNHLSTVSGAALLSALLLTACSTMPDRRAETPPLPTAWVDAPVGADVEITDWWRGFQDPALEQLVTEALANGPSVQLAASRVEEARGLSRSTITAYLPELSLIGRGQYTQALEGDISNIPNAPGAGETEQMTGAYGAQVSWEIPLFARIQASRVGARASNAIALADLRAARVALAADVAQAYVDLRAANNSRIALGKSVAVADRLAFILDASADAGLTPEASAADARRLAESARARLPGLVIEARRAENVLAVLRGITPGTESEEVRANLAAEFPVPSLPLTEAPAAPADLLRLRPDVARAEAQTLLAAATLADARADMMPQLNLTGSILTSDNLIGTSLPGSGTQVQAVPLITIPLFDWGARAGRSMQRRAQFDQALIQYRQTVTQAVAEASNALVALDQGRLRLASARSAEEAASATAIGARAAYEAGIQSLADRLRVEQNLIDASLTRIDAEAAQASAAIATYRAFGGGPALQQASR
jgi:outer membrane protein, multidrug efflux system